jgi:hypothetical protein
MKEENASIADFDRFIIRLQDALAAIEPKEHQGEPVHLHEFYKDGDADIPSALLDRNGQVVLTQCKHCGQAEVELGK